MDEENKDTKTFALKRQVPDRSKTVEGEILNQIGLTRYCCRSHIIGHIQIIDKL